MMELLKIIFGVSCLVISPTVSGTYHVDMQERVVDDTSVIVKTYQEKKNKKATGIEADIKRMAVAKLNDLANTGVWSHTNSDGCTLGCRVNKYVSESAWVGENLYRGKCSVENAYKLWNLSPTHRDVLNHSYSHEVLVSREYDGGCYIVLIRADKNGK